MIMHYELLAIVIQKCLKKIIDKMKKDIELRAGDTITAFEISLTFFVVVRQTNNFNFSDLDIVKTYKRYLFMDQDTAPKITEKAPTAGMF